MKHLMLIALSVGIFQCTGKGQAGNGGYIYWVNSLKVPCTGVSPTQCLQVQKGESMDPTQWESFYSPISGFDFEAGYLYKLLVEERDLDPASVPADASSMEYKLVEVLEKKKDKRLVVNDTWILEKLNGLNISSGSVGESNKFPQLEIQVGEMKYLGTDGCNNYIGGIIELSETTLRFGIGAGTRMMCEQMEIPDEYNRTLPKVHTYKAADLKLLLFDKEGKELMQFKKVD